MLVFSGITTCYLYNNRYKQSMVLGPIIIYMLFYNYHHSCTTCKPVYMAYDNSDVVNWENMEKCTYNTVRTCSENSIEIVQEQYENTALEKLKKEKKGKHPNKW